MLEKTQVIGGEVFTYARKITVQGDHEVTIHRGGEPVVVEKLYGPLIACSVRVRLDFQPGEWVVERQRIDAESASRWEEMARFDCQESIYFHDEENKTCPK